MTLKINDIIASFNEENCTLLSTEYKNQLTKLYYICSNGHQTTTTWKYWKRGDRCIFCGIVKAAEKNSTSFTDIEKEFKLANYTLLSTEYKSGEKLKYMCNNGHVRYASYHSFKKGQRCKKCLANSLKLDIEYIRSEMLKENYVLISTEYKSARSLLKCRCPFNHIHKTRWYNWKTGYRCNDCAKINYSINFSGENSPTWRGGLSLDNYCDAWRDKTYKEDIKIRDNYICQNPYCYKKSNKLSIHHIDYDKKNCHPSNLITVCNSCNSLANSERKWHTNWYQALMAKKYNYTY